jgi:hypothetical protein
MYHYLHQSYIVSEPNFSTEIISTSFSSPVFNTLNHAVTEKLTRENFHH